MSKMANTAAAYEDLVLSTSGNICKKISDKHVVEISGFLSEQWRKLPSYLDLEDAVLSDLEKDAKTEEERRAGLLKKWKREKGSEATYQVLIKALLDIKCKEDAESVCKLLMPMPPEMPFESGLKTRHLPAPVSKTGIP